MNAFERGFVKAASESGLSPEVAYVLLKVAAEASSFYNTGGPAVTPPANPLTALPQAEANTAAFMLGKGKKLGAVPGAVVPSTINKVNMGQKVA